MAQQPSSKQTLIIGILSGALVVSLGITSFLYYQKKSAPPYPASNGSVQTSPPKVAIKIPTS